MRQAQAPVLALALALVAACGTASPAADGAAAAAGVDGATTDGAGDLDAATADATGDAADLGCPGGPGCPCAAHADCDFPLCAPTSAGKRCARSCVDSCPDGGACVLYSGAGVDSVSVCAPAGGLLCMPCDVDAQCRTIGHETAACVSQGQSGGYCGVACQDVLDCPGGMVCKDALSREGQATRQCVPAKGTCTCSEGAKAAAAQTTCWLADGAVSGRYCPGVRVCGAAGLSACSAVGDGQGCVDVACLAGGKVGGPALAAGAPCSDGQVCTLPDVCADGACSAGPWKCECTKGSDCPDDGDLCNGKPHCDTSSGSGVCKVSPATVVSCDDGLDGPCETSQCAPETGTCIKVAKKADASCDDGVACTLGDVCDGKGSCQAGTDVCNCQSDDDCAPGADLCKGLKYCDKSSKPFVCKVNPATVVSCDTSGDTACRTTSCVATTGACVAIDADNGKACDDAETCTANDACVSGVCTPGAYVCACKQDADCVAKDDGDLCNGLLYCDKGKGQCKKNPATVVSCPSVDDTACASVQCQPKTGACVVTPAIDGKVCEDGSPCTVGDLCKGGACLSGPALGCPCQGDGECLGKDDGDVCNGTLFCDKAKAQCVLDATSAVLCPSVDDTTCAKASCDPKTGACSVKAVPAGAPCDDGSPCTLGDTCQKGACAAGSNICPCEADAACLPKDDGDLCNGVLYCDKVAGACKPNPKTVVSCPSVDDTTCSQNTCDAKLGSCAMQPAKNATPCDDGSPCSTKAVCVDGVCKAASLLGCDDGKVCTDDACDPKEGCVHKANSAPCPDAEPCTVDEVCVSLVCTAKQNPCDDANVCTIDACAPGKGCGHSPAADGAACDDGSACTSGDVCQAGACKPGKLKTCLDDRTCTSDGCDAKTGACAFAPLSGDTCGPQIWDKCYKGACVNAIHTRRMIWVPGGKTAISTLPQLYAPTKSWLNPPFVAMVSGFYLMEGEVDIGLYKQCQAAGVCGAPSCSWTAYSDQHPVRCVHRSDAEKFCAWWKGPVNKAGALPTLAQLQRAGRGGCEQVEGDCLQNAWIYPWGPMKAGSINSCDYAKCSASGQTPPKAAVAGGSYGLDISPYGVHDIAGSVQELTRDYSKQAWFQANAGATTMPVDPWQSDPTSNPQVIAVGGWSDGPEVSRAAAYMDSFGLTGHQIRGFRCAFPAP